MTSPSRVERLVPVSDTAMTALETAATLQQHSDNLVPCGQRLSDFLSSVRHYSGAVLKSNGLNNRHDLRAAYACDRYRQITGADAPGDSRTAVFKTDRSSGQRADRPRAGAPSGRCGGELFRFAKVMSIYMVI